MKIPTMCLFVAWCVLFIGPAHSQAVTPPPAANQTQAPPALVDSSQPLQWYVLGVGGLAAFAVVVGGCYVLFMWQQKAIQKYNGDIEKLLAENKQMVLDQIMKERKQQLLDEKRLLEGFGGEQEVKSEEAKKNFERLPLDGPSSSVLVEQQRKLQLETLTEGPTKKGMHVMFLRSGGSAPWLDKEYKGVEMKVLPSSLRRSPTAPILASPVKLATNEPQSFSEYQQSKAEVSKSESSLMDFTRASMASTAVHKSLNRLKSSTNLRHLDSTS